jgi:hypothetical protein
MTVPEGFTSSKVCLLLQKGPFRLFRKQREFGFLRIGLTHDHCALIRLLISRIITQCSYPDSSRQTRRFDYLPLFPTGCYPTNGTKARFARISLAHQPATTGTGPRSLTNRGLHREEDPADHRSKKPNRSFTGAARRCLEDTEG